jgi:hypothetical protein
MDPVARRRACVEFRAKLSRDTGTDLPLAQCESLLGAILVGQGCEQTTLHSNPGRFYACLGEKIACQTLGVVLPHYSKVALWCYRESAAVHNNPVGRGLHSCAFQLNLSPLLYHDRLTPPSASHDTCLR